MDAKSICVKGALKKQGRNWLFRVVSGTRRPSVIINNGFISPSVTSNIGFISPSVTINIAFIGTSYCPSVVATARRARRDSACG